jgi:hypothetical protein
MTYMPATKWAGGIRYVVVPFAGIITTLELFSISSAGTAMNRMWTELAGARW